MRRLAILVCLWPALARGDTPPSSPYIAKVEALFEQGTKHYDVGEYDAAIAAFKQAYALMPDPSFLFNLGQAYRQKRACREATAAYKSYLRNAPDDDRAKVEGFIRDLEPCVRVEEERARRLAPPPRLSSRDRKLRWAGIASAGAGVAILGGGIVFAVRAGHDSDRVERDCADLCDAATIRSLESAGHTADRNAKLLFAVGGATAALGASLILYTVVNGHYVTVEPTPGGAAITTKVRF